MDPWLTCHYQESVTLSEIPTALKFEDNFSPALENRLPDSEAYLAVLEEKLHKLKSDPNVLQQLAEKREACMQQLLCGDTQFEASTSLDTPISNSHILRTILPQRQALTQGEIVELVRYDHLSPSSEDISDSDVNKDSTNRTP